MRRRFCFGGQSAMINDYQRVCEIFPGDDTMAVAAGRARWQQYQTQGHTLGYWQQGEHGWEKKQ